MQGECSIRRFQLATGLLIVAAATFGAVLAVGSLAKADASTGRSTTTSAAWKEVSPASVGLDADMLDQIASVAKKGKSNCLVVVRDGKVAGQWYFNGTGPNTTQDVYSATKSFTSTLVGIAQDDGDLAVGDKASTWIPAWSGTPSGAVTVQDLLSMDSGREWSFRSDYVQLLGAPDRTAFATGLGQSEPPGTVWTYNNSAVQTLEQVLQQASGENVAAFAEERLFEPLGMTHTKMATDKAGNAQMFEGIKSTCLDMARFGELMLNDGKSGGKRIVSSAWVEQATEHSSTKLNAGYGYLWWLNRKGTLSSPYAATSVSAAKNPTTKKRQRIVPGAPSDLYWALGLGNQLIQVDPATKTVVVRLGTAEPNPQPPTFGPAEASKVVTEAVEKAGPGR